MAFDSLDLSDKDSLLWTAPAIHVHGLHPMAPLEPRDEHHLLLLLLHVRYNSLDSLVCLFCLWYGVQCADVVACPFGSGGLR